MSVNNFEKGTFGYDKAFLDEKHETVVLTDNAGKAQVLIMPQWQARVMTSTASGENGFSFGWINHDLIASGKKAEHIHAFGGEERLWLGPEGGPFSLYFAPGAEQIFDNWNVPALLDTEAFDLVSKSQAQAKFVKWCQLKNYAGTNFEMQIDREVSLLLRKDFSRKFGFELNKGIDCVGYETINSITNIGNDDWDEKSGAVSIWMLSMLNPSDDAKIIIPHHSNNLSEKVVNDDYFGKVPQNRLQVKDGTIIFSADGKHRSKIGLSALFSKGICGSIDLKNNSLTILTYDKAPNGAKYVNSKWGEQADPFGGDVINAYNDGPVEDGSQLGPFYELESSSPAAFLKRGEKICHTQRIFHFIGENSLLKSLAEKILK